MKRTVLAIGMVLVATAAGAQSLAEVAKKEEARRKEIKAPSKVLTNDDLKRYGSSSQPAPGPASSQGAPPAAGAPAAGQDAAKQAGAPPQPGTEQEPVKDEAWWRNRLGEAQAILDRDKVLVESLQTRANALVNDFQARDDPAQRAQLAEVRQRTLSELKRVQEEIAATTQNIADIREEARRAGVPPGWLR
jgi:hypothetical protein